MQKIVLSVATVLLLLPNCFQRDINQQLPYNQQERYDPALQRINTVAGLEAYTDSLAAVNGVAAGTYAYVSMLETVISNRFYHGFSHYRLNENWIAAAAGALVKEDYACKVEPEHILQHPNAACSQQSLLMMQVLRNKQLHYRKVGFPHHYALEIAVGNNWYFFDPNMEPVMNQQERLETSWQHQNDQLKKYYDPKRCTLLDFQFGTGQMAIAGPMDEVPARNARLFHLVTGIVSKTAWLLPLILLLLRVRLGIKKRRLSAFTLQKQPMMSFSA